MARKLNEKRRTARVMYSQSLEGNVIGMSGAVSEDGAL